MKNGETMRSRILALCIAAALSALLNCARADYAKALVGTWQVTGDACDSGGSCQKEIITDEESGETFTADGFLLTRRSRDAYSLKGATITFASPRSTCGTARAEIISLKDDTLLLECGNRIRRYARVTRR
jgi:hypothetical protein